VDLKGKKSHLICFLSPREKLRLDMKHLLDNKRRNSNCCRNCYIPPGITVYITETRQEKRPKWAKNDNRKFKTYLILYPVTLKPYET